MSSLGTLVLLAVPVGVAFTARGLSWWAVLLPLAVILGAALFTVRGYTLAVDAVFVHRLLWMTRLPLEGLQSAQVDPRAMAGSIRTMGNGGLYSFTGLYRNKTLGSYRAYVTDAGRAVVLRFPNRTVVVSPDSPESFVRELTTIRSLR